ncbi:MAG: hypothetical protein ACI8XO_002966 [Verrucomicrobiales bacterium]
MNVLKAQGSRRDFYTIIIGTYLLVTIYAILHDQYIVRIAPEHFTIYHDPLWGIKNPLLLAAAYAFCSAPLPALALGCVAAFISLALPKKWPPLGWRQVLRGVICVIIAAELASIATGIYAFTTKNMLYGSRLYPDKSLPLIVTQTVQLTCYLTSALFSCALFVYLIRKRVIQPLLA